ncbi:MAG: DUF72 domain-containing protein [Desulfobacterota bacterium]|jgi:uncharacterized protein YecE (DUF72 family)|nr:DUF72 domain-containing protein [Thermodesulfobacteriota bacterium]
MKIYSGTSGYGYLEWKGHFYPENISPKEMLRFYGERLPTVEINNTFYRLPSGGVLTSWAEQVPADFIFAFKAPQIITHRKRLKNVGEETAYLFRTLSLLERKLGPVLFQFPKNFPPDPARLKAFFDLIPGKTACAFEFRSLSVVTEEVLSLLQERDYSLCLADTDENPATTIRSTASWGYLRLRRSAAYREPDLSQWLERIRGQRWERAYVFFKHEEEGLGPKLARRFQELAGESPQRTT